MSLLDDSILDTLVSAMLYEPGLVDTNLKVKTTHENKDSVNENNSMPDPYVCHPPDDYEFPAFIRSFSVQNNQNLQETELQLSNNPSVCFCNGFGGNGRHMHLAFEGSFSCVQCKESFCKTCTFIPSKDISKPTKNTPNLPIYYRDCCNETMCLDCFKAKRFGEEQGSNVSDIPIESMKRTLNERVGLQLTSDVSLVETMDLYEIYVSSASNFHDSIHLRLSKEKIKFPLFPSDTIQKDTIFKPIGQTFRFSDGGRLISDKKSVSDGNIPKVLELFASLLKYDEALIPKGNTYIGKYDYLPSIFLHLAYHSRIDTGYRLLDWCARHTCDPKGGSIYFQNASFIEYFDNESKQKG